MLIAVRRNQSRRGPRRRDARDRQEIHRPWRQDGGPVGRRPRLRRIRGQHCRQRSARPEPRHCLAEVLFRLRRRWTDATWEDPHDHRSCPRRPGAPRYPQDAPLARRFKGDGRARRLTPMPSRIWWRGASALSLAGKSARPPCNRSLSAPPSMPTCCSTKPTGSPPRCSTSSEWKRRSLTALPATCRRSGRFIPAPRFSTPWRRCARPSKSSTQATTD
jgi:hypothetical protein